MLSTFVLLGAIENQDAQTSHKGRTDSRGGSLKCPSLSIPGQGSERITAKTLTLDIVLNVAAHNPNLVLIWPQQEHRQDGAMNSVTAKRVQKGPDTFGPFSSPRPKLVTGNLNIKKQPPQL